MKKCFLFLLIIVLFISCNSSPDNRIQNQKSEKGDWVFDSITKKNVQADVDYYLISPSWGQAMTYADKRSDRVFKVVLSLVFFIIFIGLFVGSATDASWLPKFFENTNRLSVSLFITIVASVYFYFGDASGVKWNNDKWVKKEVYDEAMKSGSTQAIWDSLENNCLIVDGPYNCYK